MYFGNEIKSMQILKYLKISLFCLLLTLCFSANCQNSQMLFERAVEKFQKKEFNGALLDFKKALEFNIDDAHLNFNVANCLANLKMYSESLAYYDRVISIDRNYAMAFANRGVAKRFIDDKDGAILDFSSCLKYLHGWVENKNSHDD